MSELSTIAQDGENVILKGVDQAEIDAKRVDATGARVIADAQVAAQADVAAVETSVKSHTKWYVLGAVVVAILAVVAFIAL